MGSCYLEVSLGTTGVGNLVLPGVLPSVNITWALPVVQLPPEGFYLFFFGSPKTNFRVPQTSYVLKDTASA